MNKLLLIDGNNVLHRAFHALPLLTNKNGSYTNGVYGFLKMMDNIVAKEHPTHIGICFDKGRETFRHREYCEYKAKRKETPVELKEQFPLIREILELWNYTCYEDLEYEADDFIGTISKLGQKAGMEVVLLSGDKDILQLIDDHITVLYIKKGISDLDCYDTNKFIEKYGILPERLIDLKGLMGDSSDNIPGVPGIGEKTALKLLLEYGTIENVLDNANNITGKRQKTNLIEHRDLAILSKSLATIKTDIDMPFNLNDMKVKTPNINGLLDKYRELEFRTLIPSLKKQYKLEEEPNLFNTDFTIDEPQVAKETIVYNKVDILDITKNVGDVIAVNYAENGFYVVLPSRDVAFATDDEAKLLLDNKNIRKLFLDSKLAYSRHQFFGSYDDLSILAYLTDVSSSKYTLESLIDKYLEVDNPKDDVCFAMSSTMFELYDILYGKLSEMELVDLYNNIELPLAIILGKMESHGIAVDGNILNEMSKELESTIATLTSDIYEISGSEFNINSPKQLGEILFDKLGLPANKKTKTGYSTNSEVLDELMEYHPIIERILQYRQLTKLKSTYLDAIPKLVDEKGYVHTTFQQTVTTTGRLSSTDPNLQNIPIRLEEGRKVRKAFTASGIENSLLCADYSQIELRLLAHFSEDEALTGSFLSNEDIHVRTASEVMGIPIDMVDKDMRRNAKAVNFGIIYGISDFGLAKDLAISRKEAKMYIENYFMRYPKVDSYLKGTISFAKEMGYAVTLMGRRRYLPDINAKNFNRRSFAERTAMNTPLQGTAADIIKIAMINIDNELTVRGLKSKLVLQVHDELIFDCPNDELEIMQVLVKEIMENAVKINVPLVVDMKVGYNWYDMKEVL